MNYLSHEEATVKSSKCSTCNKYSFVFRLSLLTRTIAFESDFFFWKRKSSGKLLLEIQIRITDEYLKIEAIEFKPPPLLELHRLRQTPSCWRKPCIYAASFNFLTRSRDCRDWDLRMKNTIKICKVRESQRLPSASRCVTFYANCTYLIKVCSNS